MTPPLLVLVDGHSLIYRAYYAIRRLSNREGFPTNALYGFITMLSKVLREMSPQGITVAFDVGRKTFRSEIYPLYKANRPPTPPDLHVQMAPIKEYLSLSGLPVLELENYEADDVLATLATRGKGLGWRVVVVTGDKDLLQLVEPGVDVYNPGKEILFNREKVKEVFGVFPEQIPDLLALEGDSSDNIPGVAGVGEKTAVALLQKFATLDDLLSGLERIERPALRKKIEESLENLRISRMLTPVVRDLPLPEETLIAGEPDLRGLREFYHKYGFNSLLEELSPGSEGGQKKGAYKSVTSPQELGALVERARRTGRVALDTETDSPDPIRANLVGLSLAFQPGEAFYIPIAHKTGEPQIDRGRAVKILAPLMADPSVEKVGHNLKYDLLVLERASLPLRGIRWDTMVLSYLLHPNRRSHNLDSLAFDLLDYRKIPYEALAGKGKEQITLDRVPIPRVTEYCCEDSDISLRLAEKLIPLGEKEELLDLYDRWERPLIPVLATLERNGIRVDPQRLATLSESLQGQISALKEDIRIVAGTEFNLNSPQQLGEILFGKLGLPVLKKTKKAKASSTAGEVLEELVGLHPVVEKILLYRQLEKLQSTYVKTLPLLINPETGRVHTSYNQTVAATGRLSSSDPNLQNIPVRSAVGRKIREAFVPDPGYTFLSADYSQVELRVLAHLSGDASLIEAFLQGKDIHLHTAERLFAGTLLSAEEKRRRAKVVNFSVLYGKTAHTLSRELGISHAEAQRFIDGYFDRYPGVREFVKETLAGAEERGYVKTLFGRKREIPELKSRERNVRLQGERMAVNTRVQGTAADLMKRAMIDLDEVLRREEPGVRMVLQVHDELVFEVPSAVDRTRLEGIVRAGMENAGPLSVPLTVDLHWGNNWAEA